MRRWAASSWLVWGAGVTAYAVGIMHRTSLGVVGLHAAEHFGTTAGIVSTFVVLQLACYALGQIPAGLLIDRYGPRALIVSGSLVMALSQGVIATTSSLQVAIGARILLGFGDAFLYGSVLRLLPFWFPARRVPFLTQMSGLLGQAGQIAAIAALLPVMNTLGWRPTFLAAAGAGVAIALLCLVAVRDAPAGVDRALAVTPLREIPAGLAEVVRHPATQLGFWVHLTAGFSVNVFAMMWGIPYLVIGEGRSEAQAGLLFMLSALLGAGFGPFVGWLTGRHPLRRSTLALITIWAELICWSTVLAWPGPAPMWLLVLLVASLAAGGPGTGIGFDFPRTQLPVHRLGSANGIVIAGSFSAGTLTILAIGMALDAMSQGQPYTAAQITWAMALQLPVFVVGIIGILWTRRSLRRRMADQGVVVPSWQQVAERYRRRGQNRPGGVGGAA